MGSFARSFPLASAASTVGSVVPATSASSIERPDTPRGDAVELDPGVLQDLVQPRGLALALSDLRLAIAGQVTQRPDRLGRHEARPQKPALKQLRQPLPGYRSCARGRS